MNAPTAPSEMTALSVASRQQFDLSPQTFEQALTFADYLAASEMVPRAYRGKPGDCLIAMQWGYELGLKPLQALQSIATINGKPGIYGDAGKAILLNKGCIIEEDDIAVVEKNGRARCKITRPGRPPVERTFSLDNAKTAGLWNKEGPWRSYPWRQMAWRAFWFAARDAASDLLRGMAGFEELLDIPTEKNMGAAEVVQQQTTATYDVEAFKKNLPAWRKLIESGKKTAADVIATIETKAPLSPEQKAEIQAIKPAQPAQQQAAASDPQDVQPKTTYAIVASRIAAAKDHEELDVAKDLIGEVADAQQRAELVKLADTRGDELAF